MATNPPVNPTDGPAPAYVVPPNTDAAKLQAGLATSVRDIGVVVAFGTAILGFVSKHDLAGAIAYLQSAPAVPALTLVCGIALSAYRFWNARRNVKITALAAESRPNSVVQVKES
jgi:hypothetical protein